MALTDEKLLHFYTHLHGARIFPAQEHHHACGCCSLLPEMPLELQIVPEPNHTPACLMLSTELVSSAVNMVTKLIMFSWNHLQLKA